LKKIADQFKVSQSAFFADFFENLKIHPLMDSAILCEHLGLQISAYP
jgi:hypothetical protein